jgi:hypothetical protein
MRDKTVGARRRPPPVPPRSTLPLDRQQQTLTVEMHSGRRCRFHLEHVLSDPDDRKVSSLRAHSVPLFRRVHVRTAFLRQALEVRLEGRALAAGV